MFTVKEVQKKKNSKSYQRTLTYLYLQKLICPKFNRILGGKATKKKNNVYYYYYCNDCKVNIKENVIDNYVRQFMKDLVVNLKNSFGSKDKYVLTKDDKDKLLNYIDNVNDTNNDYKNMKRLSNTLNNVDKELKEKRDIINTLTENNESLNLRVNTLTNKLTEKEE